ncbi:MAG: phosphotransferase [Methylococcaceae bacterium]|nr:phosphotransferase [Methylococcaceae bacterium]
MNNKDLRAQAIFTWLTADLSLTILDMQPASSDASFRRYFRITLPSQSWIVMDAPPERENIQPFIKMAGIMREAGVKIPQLFHINLEQGFIALEDFGGIGYLDQLLAYPVEADRLYHSAFTSLLALQQNSAINQLALPAYDVALLTRELGVFSEWFLNTYLNLTPPDALQGSVNQYLIDSAMQQPRVLVHRDFHSRNLMVLERDNPGVLDFQDAVIGPITYDLVSLLKDCYICWPEQQVDAWREAYLERLRQANLIACDSQQFKRWFDLMGMQRHLKAIGIFARLHLRDGKSTYLNDIPRTLAYVTNVCAIYPELADFSQYLNQTVLPVYTKNS